MAKAIRATDRLTCLKAELRIRIEVDHHVVGCTNLTRPAAPNRKILWSGSRSALDLNDIAKPHRFQHAPILVFDVDAVIETCPTLLPDRFRECEAGILASKLMRCGQVGKLSAILVASIDVVVEVEKVSRHSRQAQCRREGSDQPAEVNIG